MNRLGLKRPEDINDLLEWLRDFFFRRSASPDAWERLCDILELWGDHPDLASVIIPYAEAHLALWEPGVRKARSSWMVDLAWCRPAPLMPLARQASIHVDEGIPLEQALVLLRCDAMTAVTRLSVMSVDENTLADSLAGDPRSRRLESLYLSGSSCSPKGLGWLARSPHLEGLSELTWSGYNQPLDIVDILLDGFPGLTTLRLLGGVVGPRHAEAMASNAGLSRIRSLSVGGASVGDAALVELLGSAHVGSLDVLRCEGCSFTEVVVEELASWSGATELKTLALGSTGWQGERVEILASLRGLTELGISGAPLVGEGLEALCGGPVMAGLTSLQLDGCGLGDEGAEVLARSGVLEGVESLMLRDNGIGPEGVRALAGSGAWSSAKVLSVLGNDLGVEGLEALTTGVPFEAIELLMINGSKDPRWWRTLGDWAGLATIESLYVPERGLLDDGCLAAFLAGAHASAAPPIPWSDDGVTDAGLALLSESEWLGSFRALGLGGLAISDAGAARLLRSPQVSEARTVWMAGSGLTGAVLDVLAGCHHMVALEEISLTLDDEAGLDAGLGRLLSSPVCRGVRHLYVSELGPESVSAMIESPYVSNICAIDGIGELPWSERARLAAVSGLHPALRSRLQGRR